MYLYLHAVGSSDLVVKDREVFVPKLTVDCGKTNVERLTGAPYSKMMASLLATSS